ncbi:Uncharacterised protein [Mycobacteroides abscessus subsp. abscessus]|nr:Uncharacterised protein [Mycobacteroides abscessus subsp. abscessus]
MVVTSSANAAVVEEPAPRNASPKRTARASAAGACPPNQMGGCGRCTGLGWNARSATSRKRPRKVMRSSSDQASFIRSSPSVKREMKVCLSTPNAAKFRAPPPGATPTSRRPWLRRSTAVTAAANCSGSCCEATSTATPRRKRVVQAAA